MSEPNIDLIDAVAVSIQQMRFGPETLGAWLTVQFGGGKHGRKRALALCRTIAMTSLGSLERSGAGADDIRRLVEAAIKGETP